MSPDIRKMLTGLPCALLAPRRAWLSQLGKSRKASPMSTRTPQRIGKEQRPQTSGGGSATTGCRRLPIRYNKPTGSSLTSIRKTEKAVSSTQKKTVQQETSPKKLSSDSAKESKPTHTNRSLFTQACLFPVGRSGDQQRSSTARGSAGSPPTSKKLECVNSVSLSVLMSGKEMVERQGQCQVLSDQ